MKQEGIRFKYCGKQFKAFLSIVITVGILPSFAWSYPVGSRNISSEITVPTPKQNIESMLEVLLSSLERSDTRLEQAIQELSWSKGFPLPLSGEDDEYLFILQAKQGEDSTAAWAVAGDFSSWQPIEMVRRGNFYFLHLTIKEAEGKAYKFVNMDGHKWQADRLARTYRYDQNGEISYVKPPKNTWYLQRWIQLNNPALNLLPRDLVVYVPKGARDRSFERPVLYMHDGQNLFDTGSMMGGWRVQDTLEELAQTGEVVPYIVGIHNTERRMNEYTHTSDLGFPSEGSRYVRLIEENIRPFIEKFYHPASYRGIMGSSLGGLISVYQNFVFPGEYQFVAAMSPTLFWGRRPEASSSKMMLDWYRASAKDHIKPIFYLDSGGGPGDAGCSYELGISPDHSEGSDNYCETRQFADALAMEFQYTWNVNLFHWWAPHEPHNEQAWHRRLLYPMQIFVKGYEASKK